MGSRLEAVADLSQLPSISDDVIVACIRERFMSDKTYTNIGSSALAAVNPHKYVSTSADSVLHQYAAEYRDTTNAAERLPPHIFQLANNAYYHMKRTTQDQTIVFSGDTGSGKSENRRLAIKTIIELSVSSPGKKGSKLQTQIPAAEFVLETFGNARTLFNPNASRFGKYTELQFSDRGRLVGVKTLDYYLEKNRVSGTPSGERNFHIFYYLVAGASPEEREHLHLLDKTSHRYLGQRVANRTSGGREDDGPKFDQLKVALKTIGLSKRHVAQTCQLIAAILHLGNLEFTIDRAKNMDAAVVRNTDLLDVVAEFLGVSAANLEATLSYKMKLVQKELCTVYLDADGASDNRDDLAKTLYSLLFAWINEHINQRLCKDDFTTFIGMLDLPGPQNMTSRPNTLDQFCINFANERLQNWIQKQTFEHHVPEYTAEGIIDLIPKVPYFDNSECIRLLQNLPGGLIHIMDDQARRSAKKTNHSMVEAFTRRWGSHSSFKSGSIDRSGFPTFTVSHYHGPVTYSSDNFIESNLDEVNPDFISLLRGGVEVSNGSENPFVKSLFSTKAISTQVHPRNEDTIVSAQQAVKPMRTPSTRRKKTIKRNGPLGRANTLREIDETKDLDLEEEDDHNVGAAVAGSAPCLAGEFKAALDTLFETLDDTQTWTVLCINPNDSQLPNQLEGRSVKGQIRSSGLAELSKRNVTVFEIGMAQQEFIERYQDALTAAGATDGSEQDIIMNAASAVGLGEKDVVLGKEKVFLSQAAFHHFENNLRSQDVEEMKRNRMLAADDEEIEPRSPAHDPYAPYASPDAEGGDGTWAGGYGDAYNASNQALPLVANAQPFQRADLYNEGRSIRSADDFDGQSRFTDQRDDSMSNFGSESYAPSRNMFQGAGKQGVTEKEPLAGEIQEGETAEVFKETSARRRWVILCWILTWWVPGFLLSSVGRMKRPDVRQAWREKLAINILIWFICGCAIFVIAILGDLICPKEHVYNSGELSQHSKDSNADNVFVAIRGEVFNLNTIAEQHLRTVGVVPSDDILDYGGAQADNIFPVQVSALCNGIDGTVSPWVKLNGKNNTDDNSNYHDFRAFKADSRPDWYYENMIQMRYTARVGFLGYTPSEVKDKASGGALIAMYNGLIYDVSSYLNTPPTIQAPDNTQAPSDTDVDFMHSQVLDLFKYNAGGDITKKLDALKIDSDVLARQKVCLRNLFTVGKVDNRKSTQCLFATYILLAISILMVSIIGFKFLAALNFGSPRAPEDHDKFVICQVPCYTEDDGSLRGTIESLAAMKYDDKRKLILVVCDGMIVGSGNDRPTPRIVLDILGSDPSLDPEPLSFLSLGEGHKQHNMGKVFSGLYEHAGHVVPYLVLVKVGKPSERSRPGNRGKRDTQMTMMRFLNKVHFNSPMSPCELEMYHQIKNVIGVNPTFYEYLFMIDADTTVEPMSLNRLISAMKNDKKLLGVCGETELSNSKQSIMTMMQVYEYFLSHHLAKAFESLFGSVTCLPGCFTLYRLRTSDTHKPLLISNQLIDDYSENRVDTLHMKNLLHLGEDRYLTTLLLKHFPTFKTRFVRDAHAYTVAPDDFQILLSQRRRWINSTVHNLAELMFLEQLCGFCCFSMRFVVMIDLVSTLIQPVSVGYLVYLFYIIGSHTGEIPTLSLILLAAVYGLQILVFLFRRKWDMIGWMVFYICAIPLFFVVLPLYSFWKMDDFSWGQTRVVMGESGKKVVVHDEGKFDPASIPLKSWNEYENELWDKESNHSIGSWVPQSKYKEAGYGGTPTASLYGRETAYDPTGMQRSYSPAMSQMMMNNMPPPPGYQSGRNTPQSMSFNNNMNNMNMFQPAPSRPSTNYMDFPIPTAHSPVDSAAGSPSDYDLERAVQNILQAADLNTVTKRGIRTQLEEHFQMDLTPRKAVINAAIDRVLLGQQ